MHKVLRMLMIFSRAGRGIKAAGEIVRREANRGEEARHNTGVSFI